MRSTRRYAAAIIVISLVFCCITILGATLLEGKLTWLDVAVPTAVFVIADVAFIVYTTRNRNDTPHADSTQSPH